MAPGSCSEDSPWDSAYISAGGTLRPVTAAPRSRSAQNVRDYERRKRPSSKLSESSNGDKSACGGGDLNQYRRSLRLIGVPPPKPQPSPQTRPATRSARPKVSTRIQRRTVSTDDVRSAILDDSRSESGRWQGTSLHSSSQGLETASRGLVSRAVYEEWYFRKQEEAKAIREAKMKQEKERRWKEESERLEKERKSREKYLEWLKKKEERKKNHEEESKTGMKKFKPKRTNGDKEAIEAAYLKWKEEKDKEAALKREKEKKEEEEEKERKRREAEKAFEMWKKKAEEEAKKALEKQKEEERLKAEDKERQKEERQKEAESSFRAWKEAKDQEIKTKQERQKHGHWKHFWTHFDWLF